MCCIARWDEVCPLLAGGIKRNEEGTVGRERKRERVVHRLVIVGTRSFTLLNNEQRNTGGYPGAHHIRDTCIKQAWNSGLKLG